MGQYVNTMGRKDLASLKSESERRDIRLLAELLSKTDAELQKHIRCIVQPAENGQTWETVTATCCLGGCDMDVFTFRTKRDALIFSALLEAAGYRPGHNIACPECYAEYMKDCV